MLDPDSGRSYLSTGTQWSTLVAFESHCFAPEPHLEQCFGELGVIDHNLARLREVLLQQRLHLQQGTAGDEHVSAAACILRYCPSMQRFCP